MSVLDRVDLSARLDHADYKPRLDDLQRELSDLVARGEEAGVRTLLIFEGWDAEGKGGVIRRITNALDARDYREIPVAAPTEDESRYHYLWRFWRDLSRAGGLTVFDRSWYGRVLVERVEGFASEEEWHRAYAEINDFENQLIEHGTILVKFWMHISPEEQLSRFRDRKEKPYKRWKLTAEDWRNRGKWYAYERAAHDMMTYTSTHASPWELISANDKQYARVMVLETICNLLEQSLV